MRQKVTKRAAARQAHWLAVNQQLMPLAAKQLTLEWVEGKYLSVLTQQEDRTFKYVSRLKETVRNTRPVRIAAGGSNFALPTQEPADFVLVLRNSAAAELNRLSYTVAGEANLSGSLERNAELQIQLDKPSYAGGDTMNVSIRAPYIGSGLITIERESVYLHQWFKTTTTSSVQRVTLPRGFEGNGYVSVQFLLDPASDEIFMSPLSYIPGKSPIRVSQLHRAVTIDIGTGRPACPPYAPNATRQEIFEFWPSDMMKLFREAGMPRRQAPAMPDCAVDESADIPNIATPLRGVIYTLRRRAGTGTIPLEAGTAADVENVFWFDGAALIAKSPADHGAVPWTPAADGIHLIRVIDDHGRTAERDVNIQFAN